MSDFCCQCMDGSTDLVRPDGKGDEKFPALCEGCGWTITDRFGNCLHCMNKQKWNLP